MGSNVIKESPGVGQVTWVNVVPLVVSRAAEDGPGNAGLKLKVVKGYGEGTAHGVLFAEMRDDEFGVHYSLFGVEVVDVHAAEMGWAVSDGSGCGLVYAHLRKEGWEVFGLDGSTLFLGKAGGAHRVLDHHAPYCAEADADVFATKGGCCNTFFHEASLVGAVLKFVLVVTVRCKAYAKGAFACGRGYSLDRGWVCGVGSGCELDLQIIVGSGNHLGCACWGEVPFNAIPETFCAVEGATGCVE
jgi:hypothetical protein